MKKDDSGVGTTSFWVGQVMTKGVRTWRKAVTHLGERFQAGDQVVDVRWYTPDAGNARVHAVEIDAEGKPRRVDMIRTKSLLYLPGLVWSQRRVGKQVANP